MVRFKQINVRCEEHGYPMNAIEDHVNHITGKFYWCDVLKILPSMLDEYENKIQLVYMDPPFMTGQMFRFQQPIGTEGWRGNREYVITHNAYDDLGKTGKDAFLSMMRSVLTCVYRLLSPEGSLYLHIDYRTSAYLRIMLDEIFGEDNLLNEIIWHYQSGGRSKKHFSRKHDTILFYRKSPHYYFNLEAVGVPRGKGRRNHMKQGVDEDGRVFWSIKSGAKEYRYYEDSKVYPSDVWDDISHLHQRDPERSGYDTQKPEALLERIILVSSRPGDIVADFFAGSGTTLAVAQRLGRNWIGVDNGVFSLHTCRKRLTRDIHNGNLLISRSYDENHLVNEDPAGDQNCNKGLPVGQNSRGNNRPRGERCIKLLFHYCMPPENPMLPRQEMRGDMPFSAQTGRHKLFHTDLKWDMGKDMASRAEMEEGYCNEESRMLPKIDLECIRLADDQVEIRLCRYEVPGICTELLKLDKRLHESLKGLHLSRLDLVDYWAAGYVEENIFKALSCSMRTTSTPYLKEWLRVDLRPNYMPVIHIVDVLGQQWFFELGVQYVD